MYKKYIISKTLKFPSSIKINDSRYRYMVYLNKKKNCIYKLYCIHNYKHFVSDLKKKKIINISKWNETS